MDTHRPSSSGVFATLARWLAFATTLLACARRASNMHRTSAPEAWACAQQMELCACVGLIEIMRDVREIHAREDTLTGAEQHAFRRLTTITGTLIALAFFAEHLQRQLAGRSAGFFLANASCVRDAALGTEGILGPVPGYLDSS